jgi:hypothetical protein
MKKSIKQFLGLFLISIATHAQVDIVKSNYTVTNTDNVTLTASNSIRLLPNTWIKAGSTFVSKIDVNLPPALRSINNS